MKIAGIYPQEIEYDKKIQHAISEPYGLEMILAIAKQENHEVELFTNLEEINGQVTPIDEQKLIRNIMEFKPDVAAFSLYTCQYPAGKRIAQTLKSQIPKIINIAGNRYPTFLKNTEEPFDFMAVKEGEETFKEFLRELTTTKDFSKVKGLSFRQNNQTISTELRQRNLHLDTLPNALRFPIILKQTYQGLSIPTLSENPHFAIMEYSRCCYNNCKFCDNKGFWGNRVVFRSANRVVDEMFELKEKGVNLFYFMDLNFTALSDKTKELCKTMIDRKLNASWYCMSNTSTADNGNGKELLSIMKEAGCFKIAWGVESTNDLMLKKMNKKVGIDYTTSQQTNRVLQNSLETGIVNQGFYIIGFPWENQESIIKDAENLKDIPMHLLNIGIFTPIPLSRFHREMLEEGYSFDSDLEKHNRNNLVYNHKSLTNNTLKCLQQRIYNEFYESQDYLQRIETTCRIEPRLKKSFNDYSKFLNKEAKAA